MLQALLQTISNLGFDAAAINQAFNQIVATIRAGDVTSLDGLTGVFSGVLAVITGISAADIGTVLNSLISSVINVLSNDGASTVLSTITGA